MYILLDTDFLYNLFFENQSNHQKSKEIFNKFLDADLLATKLVKYEFLTVISNKENHKKAVEANELLKKLEVNFLDLDSDLEEKSLNIFLSHKKDKTSFIDSANLAVAQKYNCKIASFDKFYPNNLFLK